MKPNSKQYGSIPTVSHGDEDGMAGDKVKSSRQDGPPTNNHFWCLIAGSLFAVACLVYFMVQGDRGDIGGAGTRHSHELPDSSHKYNRHNPLRAMYFKDAIVNHNKPNTSGTYLQKYYENLDFFGGPGHPLFVIMGGEDPIDRILYPFVSEHLAKSFYAYTMCIEHRFYGESWPLKKPTNADLRELLSPRQALQDAVRLVQDKRKELGCGPKGTSDYCPVVTVGASYPGFLSALMRMAYPDVVDIGYASSTPLHLYSHDLDRSAYFEKITEVADDVSPGCAKAVKDSLLAVKQEMLSSDTDDIKFLAAKYGVCTKNIPDYIQTKAMFVQETLMVVSMHFAEYDMEYYPPGPTQDLVVGCKIFQNKNYTPGERLSAFLRMQPDARKCFDLNSEVPPGQNGTISAADWSGVGGDASAWMWDFQSCTLIPENSISNRTMFPPRKWTLGWLTDHCQSRFGYTPHPDALKNEFGFDNLTAFSRLLFTNGLRDGWSVASVTADVSDSIKAINMFNGAHHSDLTHEGPSDNDTLDVKDAHKRIFQLVGEWLDQVREEN